MPQNDLTTLALVKAYAQTTASLGGNPNVQDDPLISSMITSISQIVKDYISNTAFLYSTFTDTFTGQGCSGRNQKRPFNMRPVVSVQSLKVNGATVPANPNPPTGAGYVFDAWDGDAPAPQQYIRLNGYSLNDWNPNNITLVYKAGYLATETLPAALSLTPASPSGVLLRDEGVVYAATGVALVAVAANPAQGQYVAPKPLLVTNPSSNYTFNATDVNQLVTISYSFSPAAIEMAVRMWVADQYKYRHRVGERSQSQGGVQMASFNISDMPVFVKMALDPYKSIQFLFR